MDVFLPIVLDFIRSIISIFWTQIIKSITEWLDCWIRLLKLLQKLKGLILFLGLKMWVSLENGTIGLNTCVTLKKLTAQAEHIFDTFEYFWVDHKSKFFCNCLATRWRHHRFCWKLEFWAEIFFWWILLGKKWLLGNFGFIFCPKMGLKCPKTRLFYCAFSY